MLYIQLIYTIYIQAISFQHRVKYIPIIQSLYTFYTRGLNLKLIFPVGYRVFWLLRSNKPSIADSTITAGNIVEYNVHVKIATLLLCYVREQFPQYIYMAYQFFSFFQVNADDCIHLANLKS